MISINFRRHNDAEKKNENSLLSWIIKMQILLASAVITSTARVNSVVLSSYRNSIFNQSINLIE